MSDIVERLREPPFGTETSERNLMNAAADEITRLRADNISYKIGNKDLQDHCAEVERLTAERDRQYDQNTEQITRIAALEAENERLLAALRKIAGMDPWSYGEQGYFVARAALKNKT